MLVSTYASSVCSALIKDLSDIVETVSRKGFEDRTVTRRPSEYDIDVTSFAQTWGSTALGFGGIGGAAMTTAMTVIVRCRDEACVYFGGQFAYRVTAPNAKFTEDIAKRRMASVSEAENSYI